MDIDVPLTDELKGIKGCLRHACLPQRNPHQELLDEEVPRGHPVAHLGPPR
jgi:hypothetical protein